MSRLLPSVGQQAFMERGQLHSLLGELRKEGYTVLGPVVDEGVIAIRPIESADEIARGVRDEQNAGTYKLVKSEQDLYFQYVVGADSPKRRLFPPEHELFSVHTVDGQLRYDSGPPKPPKLALLGVRPCELAAMEVQDRIFTTGTRCETDAYYAKTRQQMMVIAVNCTRPGGTCFCASWRTGPAAKNGFDLALTELRSGFVMKVGSARGASLAGRMELRQPTAAEVELADLRLEQAAEHMGRHLDTQGVKELLDAAIENPRWEQTAKRCLACGNCTMVCPTCFCSSVVDSSDLTGGAMRMRVWDCCYTHQFTYTTAGPVRASIMARYRHWLRHKLGTWHDQFGTSGCVGCGRCITWCPVGIDLTEEIRAIRAGATTAIAPVESEAKR